MFTPPIQQKRISIAGISIAGNGYLSPGYLSAFQTDIDRQNPSLTVRTVHVAKASKQQQYGEAVNCKARSLHSRRNFIGLQSCCWYYCSSRLCRQQQPAYVALPAKVKASSTQIRTFHWEPLLRVQSFSCTNCTKTNLILVLQCCGIIDQTNYVFQKLCFLFRIKDILSSNTKAF